MALTGSTGTNVPDKKKRAGGKQHQGGATPFTRAGAVKVTRADGTVEVRPAPSPQEFEATLAPMRRTQKVLPWRA